MPNFYEYINKTIMYTCNCGKQFNKAQSLNAHYSHCLIHRNGKLPIDKFKDKRGWCKGKTYEEYLGKEKANEYKNILSNSLKQWHKKIGFSEETKNKLSEKRKKYLENNPHIKWFIVSNGEKDIKVQGKWEYNVAQWLNTQNIKWDRKTLIYDNHRRYTPDFYLIELDEYLEVKGWLKESDKEKMNKIIKEKNIKIKILYKEDYKKLQKIDISSLKYF